MKSAELAYFLGIGSWAGPLGLGLGLSAAAGIAIYETIKQGKENTKYAKKLLCNEKII